MLFAALSAIAVLAAAPANAEEAGSADGVVLVGVPGLSWGDIDEERTPHLWSLVGGGASGAMSVRTIGSWTCPEAGWVSVGAGARAGGLNARDAACEAQTRIPAPVRGDDGTWTLPWYAELAEANAAYNYGARLGSLADAAREQGSCVAAIGRGGALAAADTEGRIDYYSPDLSDVRDAVETCRIVVVDPGVVVSNARPDTIADPDVNFDDPGRDDTDPGKGEAPDEDVPDSVRQERVRSADEAVGTVLEAIPSTWRSVVAGISDTGYPSRLHPVLYHGRGVETGSLTSPTTGRDGYVQLVDLAPTLLESVGMESPSVMSGRAVEVRADEHQTAAAARERGWDETRAAAEVARVMPGFFTTLAVVGTFAVAAGAWMVLRRARHRGAEALCTAAAAMPLGALAASVPAWWRTEHPQLSLWAVITGVVAVLVALAQWGPLRRRAHPALLVSVPIILYVVVDQVSGSTWPLHTPMGYTAQAGARFAGLGNYAFAAFTAAVVLTIALTPWDRSPWRPDLARFVGPVALSLAAVAITGAPTMGRNVGGTITLVAALIVTCWVLWGRRFSLGLLLGAGAIGVVVIALAGIADYMRPADSQTHLGRFVGSVLSGDAGDVLARKITAAVSTLWHTPLVAVVAVAAVASLLIWRRLGRPRHDAVYAAMTGLLIASAAGFALNDSGITIPAFIAGTGFTLLAVAATPVAPDRSGRPLAASDEPEG